jgi:hypothetical protein
VPTFRQRLPGLQLSAQYGVSFRSLPITVELESKLFCKIHRSAGQVGTAGKLGRNLARHAHKRLAFFHFVDSDNILALARPNQVNGIEKIKAGDDFMKRQLWF